MKKPKISLDKDKLQQFFLQHIEKILLVIVVSLMFLLIYRGFSLPHLDSSLSPQALVSQSNSAKQYVDDPNRWTEVLPTRPVNYNIVAGVKEVIKPSDPLAYMLVTNWSRPDFPKLSPREDPTLFPPEKLLVHATVGALASYPKSDAEYTDPLFPQMSDEDLKKAREKMKREEAKKKKAAASDLGGEMPGGEGGGRPTRKKKGKTTGGEEGGEMPGGRMPGGMGGMGGMYGGMTPTDRYPESFTTGFTPQSPEQTITRNVASVTIMGLVPIQKQTEEYEKKLANSLDYDPRRDIPYYMEFRVQRADVTEIDPATEADKLPWQNLPRPAVVLSELYGDPNTGAVGLYAGIPMEVSDPSYLSEVLTHPAPPYLQRDLWDLLTHPDVPLASFNQGYGEGMPGAAGGAAAAGGDPGDDAPAPTMMGPGRIGGMPGGEGGMPGGGMMRPGFGRPGGGEGGMMPGGGMPGGGMGMRPGGMGMPGGGMPGGGMPGGGMMGMRPGGMGMPGGEGGMGYGGGMAVYTPPKYQLLRFTDIHVEPGHKYRYRFRLTVHDPNHPDLMYYAPPSAASLHDNVRKRLKEIDTADAAKPKSQQTGLAYRTSWVFTPWSEPSPIAEVPSGQRVYASKVTPRSPTKIKGVDVPMQEPSIAALAVVFDHSKRADVPAEVPAVYRGYVLNFSLDSKDKAPKVIHPVTKEIVELDKYNMTTNVMVADLIGGDTIKPVYTGSGSTALSSLGEMLVVDSDGRLHVQNEGEDILQYRRFTVPKEDKTKKTATDSAMPGGDGAPVRPGRASN